MPFKRCLNQLNKLKAARANTIQACKKRKSETSFILNVNLEIEDDKPNITDTSNIRVNLKPGFGIKTQIKAT